MIFEFCKQTGRKLFAAATAGTVGYEVGKNFAESKGEMVIHNTSVEKIGRDNDISYTLF